MTGTGVESLTKIAEKSNNDIIVLVVVLSILAIVLAIPLFKTISSYWLQKGQQDNKNQDRLIDVVERNSKVMSELTTLLKKQNQDCSVCRQEQTQKLSSINELFDNINVSIAKIETKIKQG